MKTLFLILCGLALCSSQAATLDQQAEAHFTRGEAAEKRGDTQIAAVCYQLAIRAKPDHQAAQKRIQEIGKLSGTLGPSNQITGKLILPQVSFSGATLDEAIEFLRAKSRDFDPLGRGVDIIHFPSAKSSSAQISLDLRDVPFEEALRYITQLANVKFRWEDGRVLVLPPGQQNLKFPVVSSASPVGNASVNPGKWVLPKVEIKRAPLEEVFKYLKSKSMAVDPQSKGLDYAILDASGKPTNASNLSIAPISLEVHQISMESLLRFIAQLAGVSIQIEEARIVVRAGLSKTSPAVAANSPVPAESKPAASPTSQIHAWTNQSGVIINAAFVGLDGDAVVIRKDGKEFTIPFSKLNAASQEQAMKLSVAQPAR